MTAREAIKSPEKDQPKPHTDGAGDQKQVNKEVENVHTKMLAESQVRTGGHARVATPAPVGSVGNVTIANAATPDVTKIVGELGNQVASKTPDLKAVSRLLDPLSAADHKLIDKKWGETHKKADGSPQGFLEGLGETMKKVQNPKPGDSVELARIKGIFKAADGRREAANFNVSLAMAEGDPSRAAAVALATGLTLNRAQWNDAGKDYKALTGKDLGEAIQQSKLPAPYKAMLDKMIKTGVDQLTASDIKSMASLAVESKDLKLLQSAMTGSFDAVRKARLDMQKEMQHPSSDLAKKFDAAFPDKGASATAAEKSTRKIAEDLVSTGRISLNTVLTGDARVLARAGVAVANALQNRTADELKDWAAGKDLSLRPDGQLTADQLRQKQFYKTVESTIKTQSDGDWSKDIKLRDSFMNGKRTVLSDVADMHKTGEGSWWNPFGAKGEHSAQGMFARMENMSREDWNNFRSPEYRQRFFDTLKHNDIVKEGSEEWTRLKTMIEGDATHKGKAQCSSYEESTGVRRSLNEVLKDNPAGQAGRQEALSNYLATMNSKDAAAIKAAAALSPDALSALTAKVGPVQGQEAETLRGAQLLKDLKAAGKENSWGDGPQMARDAAAKALAAFVLNEVIATGKAPQAGALTGILGQAINGGTSASDRMAAIGTLMQSPSLQSHMKEMAALSPQDLQARVKDSEPWASTYRYVQQEMWANSGIPMGNINLKEMLAKEPGGRQYADTLGSIVARGGGALGFENTEKMYAPLAGLKPSGVRPIGHGDGQNGWDKQQEQWQRALELVGPERAKILEKVASQGGQMTIADRLMSNRTGDKVDLPALGDDIAKLWTQSRQSPEKAAELKGVVADLVNNYSPAQLSKVVDALPLAYQDRFRQELNPNRTSGRETLVQNEETNARVMGAVPSTAEQTDLARAQTTLAGALKDADRKNKSSQAGLTAEQQAAAIKREGDAVAQIVPSQPEVARTEAHRQSVVPPPPSVLQIDDKYQALAKVHAGQGIYQAYARLLREATGVRNPDHKVIMTFAKAYMDAQNRKFLTTKDTAATMFDAMVKTASASKMIMKDSHGRTIDVSSALMKLAKSA